MRPRIFFGAGDLLRLYERSLEIDLFLLLAGVMDLDRDLERDEYEE